MLRDITALALDRTRCRGTDWGYIVQYTDSESKGVADCMSKVASQRHTVVVFSSWREPLEGLAAAVMHPTQMQLRTIAAPRTMVARDGDNMLRSSPRG